MLGKIQKTYKGKTAGGFAKTAKLATMRAGNVEITSDDLPGCVLMLSEDDCLVVTDVSGWVVSLDCSASAASFFRALTDRADAQMLTLV